VSLFPVLLYVHILLMVFWVGTDVGVFISALRYIDPKRSLVERAGAMSLGAVADRYPRICFVAILPVGLQIATTLGLIALADVAMVAIWCVSAVWMLTVVRLMMLAGTPATRPWQLLERVLLVTGLLGFAGSGAAGLAGLVELPGWLAGKLVCYGAICLFGLCLDHSFVPVVEAFGVIETQGSTPEREALLRGRMIRSLSWVLAIYAAVLTAGFLGTVKP
jgi:hypothetical protein